MSPPGPAGACADATLPRCPSRAAPGSPDVVASEPSGAGGESDLTSLVPSAGGALLALPPADASGNFWARRAVEPNP